MTASRLKSVLIACFVLASNGAWANAEVDDLDSRPESADGATVRATGRAGMLFLAQSPAIAGRQGLGLAFGGYDGALGGALFESAAEVRVLGPVAVRAGAVYSASSGRLRPSIGGKAQIFAAGAHGVDGTVGLFYRPEGLTEPEGEIEGFVAVGRAFGEGYFVGNLFYGQDPEGNERDGEVRLAGLVREGRRLLLGLDGRVRFDLGSDPAKLSAHDEATFDALAGPVVNVVVGPVALFAQGGASVRRVASVTKSGGFAMAGIGTAF